KGVVARALDPSGPSRNGDPEPQPAPFVHHRSCDFIPALFRGQMLFRRRADPFEKQAASVPRMVAGIDDTEWGRGPRWRRPELNTHGLSGLASVVLRCDVRQVEQANDTSAPLILRHKIPLCANAARQAEHSGEKR